MNAKEDQSEIHRSEKGDGVGQARGEPPARRSSSPDARGAGRGGKSPEDNKNKEPGELGRALKTVYDDTLREDVPKDFLDLLGKLN